ncbi:MAG: aldehyde dehydrogenase family protein, partial [Pseudorhodoplanes sp.]
MNIEQANLPRVTYTNTASDFEPLQKMMDAELPRFRQQLGAHWSNRIEGRNDDEGTRYECRSPIDRRLLLATGTEPSPAAIRRAVAAARRGADVWGQMRWQERVVAMRRFARVLDAHKYKLAMAVLYETGKMRLEALGETEEAVALIEHYCDQMEANNGFIHDPVTAGSGEKAQVVLRPYGVFAVISPFNYPTALVAGMVGAALVTGNAVILKASPQAVLTAGMFTAAVEEAKLPPGTFNLLCGEASGPLLVN